MRFTRDNYRDKTARLLATMYNDNNNLMRYYCAGRGVLQYIRSSVLHGKHNIIIMITSKENKNR